MDDLDLLDGEETRVSEVPNVVKTLSILSIIGNSLWLLMFIAVVFYFLIFATAFGGLGGGMFAGIFGVFAIAFLLILMLPVLGIVAAARLINGRKGAYILYAITNGLWALLCLMSAIANNQANDWFTWFCGLTSIGFIIAIGTQMKNMPAKKMGDGNS
jgi:hypothetical protein